MERGRGESLEPRKKEKRAGISWGRETRDPGHKKIFSRDGQRIEPLAGKEASKPTTATGGSGTELSSASRTVLRSGQGRASGNSPSEPAKLRSFFFLLRRRAMTQGQARVYSLQQELLQSNPARVRPDGHPECDEAG